MTDHAGWGRAWWGLGRRVAPPRFVLFALVLAGALVAAIPPLGHSRGIMAAFDGAAIVFLLSLVPLLSQGEPARMRRAARENDANRAVLLCFTGLITVVVLVAVAGELKGRNDAVTIGLVIATLILAWLFSNVVYALHYAHLWYSEADGRDAGGLDFPGDDPTPDYGDFLYFSFTLGMTFQTSDVTIASPRLRRVALGHSMAAFVFNLGVVAFTVNVIGG